MKELIHFKWSFLYEKSWFEIIGLLSIFSFLAYEINIFFEIIICDYHISCTLWIINTYLKDFLTNMFFDNLMANFYRKIGLNPFKRFFNRSYLGQFLSNFKKLGTVMIGKAISLIWVPTTLPMMSVSTYEHKFSYM